MIILFINCVAEYSNVQISGYYSMIRKFWKESNFLFSNYFDHSPTFWSIHSPKLFDLDLNITSTFFIASHLFLLSINASTPFWMFQRVVRWTWPCTLVWAQPVWSSGLWSSWWRGCSRSAKAGTTRSTPWLAAVSLVETLLLVLSIQLIWFLRSKNWGLRWLMRKFERGDASGTLRRVGLIRFRTQRCG